MHTAPLADEAVVYRWDWLLRATPEQLWPLVSDTNRVNQLASMAPASFEETPNPDGGAERTGSSKMLGLGVTWDEHPFEWLYPQGFSVLREFHNGVLKAYRSSVVLQPEGTGTRLVHMVELVPRIGIMAPFVRREGPKQQRNWDHAYRAIDAYLAGDGPWPFEGKRRVRLDAPLKAVAEEIELDSPAPELERRLFQHVLETADGELTHIRPFVLADRWRAPREAVLQLCAYGVRRKLLQAQWSLLCPHCRGAKGTASRPEELASQVYCNSCNITFGKASDDVVELTLRPNPRYRRVAESSFCVGGPGSTPHVLFQARLAPGSARDVALCVDPGTYRLRGARMKGTLDVGYEGCLATEEALELPVFELTPEGVLAAEPYLSGPRLSLRLLNTSEMAQDVVLETRDWRDDCVTLAYLQARANSDPQVAFFLA